MTKNEYLLTILNEELLEIQIALKSGLVDKTLRNKEIEIKINGFISVWQMLSNKNILNPLKVIYNKPITLEINIEEEIKDSCMAMQYNLFKALRFGLDDLHSLLKESNQNLLEHTANNIYSLITLNATQFRLWNDDELQTKKDKVLKWMEHAKKKGTLV